MIKCMVFFIYYSGKGFFMKGTYEIQSCKFENGQQVDFNQEDATE